MGIINVLDFHVANLIAAGEVVDRPASVVKELMENAIDAGANAITVEIKRGGVSFIRITDNGCGMAREDVPVALKRHATSKIHAAEDLDTILTLGFRGEALAAISAVSELRIMTKRRGDPVGTVLESSGGTVTSVTASGCPDGTTIIVENLFFNTPARLKFLKKDGTEAAGVASYVEKIALSHPEITIRFISDGVLKYSTAGDGNRKTCIYAVLGRDFSRKTMEVRGGFDGVDVTGFIGTPENVRGNRNLQVFFINNRFIRSKTVCAALEQAYATYIPGDKFPCAVLYLEMNPALVDVNVHPAKLEVKFSNERLVFESVYYAVRGVLEQSLDRPELKLLEKQAKEQKAASAAVGFAPLREGRGGEKTATVQSMRQTLEAAAAEAAAVKPSSAEDSAAKITAAEKSAAEKSEAEKSAAEITAGKPEAGKGTAVSAEPGEPLRSASVSAGGMTQEEYRTAFPTAGEPLTEDTLPPLPPLPEEAPPPADEAFPVSIPVLSEHAPIPDCATPDAAQRVPAESGDTQTVPPAGVGADPVSGGEESIFSYLKLPPLPGAAGRAPSPAAPKTESPAQPASAEPAEEPAPASQKKTEAVPAYRMVGEVFQCYVILEAGDTMYLVDKHAAHERILFEEFKACAKNSESCSQMMLMPLEITLSAEEAEAAETFRGEITDSGFDFTLNGRTAEVSRIPAFLDTAQAEDAFCEACARLADHTGNAALTREVRFEKALFQASCKAAVKAGRSYDAAHLKWICDRVLSDPEIRYCPHGRPVCFEMTKAMVENRFGRT